ncbi:MAG: gamma-glutamyl-gamma-aminobutyrate hydrolase family protein [archaeon]|nr:gamma-glutamyl-gamma-aminobutyrate hydrolase family protein [archaeon]
MSLGGGYRVGIAYDNAEHAEPYRQVLIKLGLEPVSIIWWREQPDMSTLRGVLFTGGVDVDPSRYGQEALATTQEPQAVRDELELKVMAQCLEMDLPLFAICRGMQLLNVCAGGTLHQDIPGHEHSSLDAHPVSVQPGTLLDGVLQQSRQAPLQDGDRSPQPVVNSRHHQAVDRLAPSLVPSAASSDQLVEAIESPVHRFVLGVQWHPEDRFDTHSLDHHLFQAFAHQVRAFPPPSPYKENNTQK